MRICYGWARRPMVLSLEQRYHPEQLMTRLPKLTKSNSSKSTKSNPTKSNFTPLAWMPIWIHMDNHYVRLNSKEEVELACKLACIYHNGLDNRAPYGDDSNFANFADFDNSDNFDNFDTEDWQFIDPTECPVLGVSKASSTEDETE